MTDLPTLLSAGYAARVQRKGSLAKAEHELREAMADASVKAAAMEILARLDPLAAKLGSRHAERDYAGSVHRDLLRRALNLT
jgi:hypothetical protein